MYPALEYHDVERCGAYPSMTQINVLHVSVSDHMRPVVGRSGVHYCTACSQRPAKGSAKQGILHDLAEMIWLAGKQAAWFRHPLPSCIRDGIKFENGG